MNHKQHHTYPAAEWSGGSQPYTASNYSSTSYTHSGSHDIPMAPQLQPGYGVPDTRHDASYQGSYYSSPPAFPSHSVSTSGQQIYSPASQGMSPPHRSQSPQRPGHSHLHSKPYSHSHSPYSQAQSQSHYSQTRTSSHSQTPQYPRTTPIVIAHPSHYSQVPPPQGISISPQYPATPSRPFSCDLCALSFNRQHDLKRHRETHTGEKPYLCNGGCGKTFTRKDALKRHQLVKGCGKVDEAWP